MAARRIAHILIPVDFGPASEAALTYAKMLAGTFGASVHLLHIMEDWSTSGAFATGTYGATPAGFGNRYHLDAGTRLCNLLSRDEVIRFHATSAVVFGVTSESIAEYAEENDIDLIVMGTHGCHEFANAMLESVAERVIHTAPCPVLTVRESGAVRLRNFEREHIRVPMAACA